MKGKMNKGLIVFIVMILIFSSSLSSVGFTADALIDLRGKFADIKIFNNNQLVNLGKDTFGKDFKPFLANGTTYVPVRAISEVLGKTVLWDGINNRIDITDKPDEGMKYMLEQMAAKQVEITELKAKIADLETQLSDKGNTSNSTISELEKYLNKQHDVYKSIGFDINVSGNSKSIKLRIYIDKGDSSKWNSLSTANIKTYIQDIVDDIKYDFKDADISGYIEDRSTSKEVADFYLNTRGSLVIETNYNNSSSGSYDLRDLEDDLNYYWDRFKDVSFSIELYGDKDDIRVYVDVDSNDWSDLSWSNKEVYLEYIYEDIVSKYKYANITGYIEDGSHELYRFDFDSKGNVDIW